MEETQLQNQHDNASGTLGAVLYADRSIVPEPERDWVALIEAIAKGDQLALHALYERSHRPVYTLIVRITNSRENAEELTLDVFHDAWRRAASYDPANGTVLGWIMNQARSRAIDRLRFEQRQKRSGADGDRTPVVDTSEPQTLLAFNEQRQVVRTAVSFLTPDERQAINAVYFSGLTHAEVALRFNQPLGTIKTRIRTALQKLRQKLAEGLHK